MIKCRGCHKQKPLKSFLSKRGLALFHHCSKCREATKEKYWANRTAEIQKASLYYQQHREERNEYFKKYLRRRAGTVPLGLGRKTKFCPTCERIKQLKEFGRNRISYDSLQSECQECKRRRGREYVHRNKKKLAERYQQYKKENLTKIKERSRLWKRNHKDKVNADTHRRRARLKGDGHFFTDKQWVQLVHYYSPGRICLCCGKRER